VDYHVFKAMLNRYYARYAGGDQRPVFFDINATYPSLADVTRGFPVIRQEFDQLIERGAYLPAYHEVDAGERAISAATAKNWGVFMLDILGHKLMANRALCPRTCAILDQIPNMLQAFFSVLDPGKSIPEHEGPYLGYLRYHLALRVPAERPPTLWLSGRPYVWKTGEAVLFDDSWPHSVENHSHEMRAVLIVDVLRPMPFLPSLVNSATTKLLARHTYGRKVADRARQFTPLKAA